MQTLCPAAPGALGRLGNVQQRAFLPLASRPIGRFYWSVQAVDIAFAGAPFAPENSITLWPVLGTESGIVPGDSHGDGNVKQAELDLVLAGYFPYNPWLYLTDPAGLGETNVTFALTNSTAGAYSVLVSTNLADWENLGPANQRYQFTDTNAPALPQRCDRFSWPQAIR